MSRLGEILLKRGALQPDTLRAGLEACKRHGGRLGTWLVRLGFISEATLLDALVEQTGCPPARALDLATAPTDVRRLIPHALAQRSQVVAFARRGRTLEVAMATPNDLLLVDEIAGVTGLVVRPHVATEAALAAALAIPASRPEPAVEAPPPGAPKARSREWRQFWLVTSSTQELFRTLDTLPAEPPAHTAAAFPSLAVLGEAGAAAADALRGGDLEDLGNALSGVFHRQQVAAAMIDFLRPLASRVALFSMYQQKVMGWAAEGAGVVLEDFQNLILPLDRPSVFLNVASAGVHIGPLVGGEGNGLLLDALGPPQPREAVVLPLQVRKKAVGFVWLDRGEEPVSGIDVASVKESTRLASIALEVLVLRQKIRSSGRLTQGGGPD